MATRATTVTLDGLSKSINKAVVLAGKRYGVGFGSDNIIYNWEILGRVLRELSDLKPGGELDVANGLARAAGLKGTPVATKFGKDILVGVIARDIGLRF